MWSLLAGRLLFGTRCCFDLRFVFFLKLFWELLIVLGLLVVGRSAFSRGWHDAIHARAERTKPAQAAKVRLAPKEGIMSLPPTHHAPLFLVSDGDSIACGRIPLV